MGRRDANPVPPETLRWAAEAVGSGSRITSVRRLARGGWHVNHAVNVLERGGRVRRLVLRRWARHGWELADPDFTARREAEVLTLLADSTVPAPRLVAADPEPTVCDVPALLLTRLPGHPPERLKDVEGFLTQLANVLQTIHAVDGRGTSVVPAYRRYADPGRLVLPAWLPASDAWERALEVARRPPPAGPSCFIHRDYHPGNTLWLRGRLTGIVDWTRASWGSPSVDLGHMRWNLAVEHGPEVADRFLEIYRDLGGEVSGSLWYWDLVTVMDLFADAEAGSPLPKGDLMRLERHVVSTLPHV